MVDRENLKNEWIEVSYCCPSIFDNKTYSSGSVRIWSHELHAWLLDRMKSGPILITNIKVL